MALLDAALEYASKGQPVFPLRPKGKEPLTPNGMKDATTDYAKIREWWEATPDANIGLPCHGFDVLDVDDGGDETLRHYPPLPDTAIVQTPTGGRHIYFKPCRDMVNSVKFLPGLDYRADGKGYVVAPPSVNGKGGWEWVKRCKLAEAPEWLKNANRKKERKEVPEQIPQGQRNDTLISLAGKARYVGLGEAEILAVLRSINEHRVSPKEDDRVLVDMAARAAKFDTGILFSPIMERDPELKSGWVGQFKTDKKKEGIESGIDIVDTNTVTNGYPNGQFTVVMAASGVGKSTLKLQSVLHQLAIGHTVFYVTLADLEGEDLYNRLVKMQCGWFGGDPPLDPDTYERWVEAREGMDKSKLWVHDVTQHREHRDIEKLYKYIVDNHQGSACIYIDYAQKLRAKGARGINETAEECATAMSWLAKDVTVPIVIGSQVSTSEDGGEAGVITKGGRVWFEECGLALHIHRYTEEQRVKLDAPYNTMKDMGYIKIIKNRFGSDYEMAMAQFSRQYARWDIL